MNFFISDAFAETTTTAHQSMGGAYGSILMLVGFVLIFYFLLLRPQTKRAKEHRELISNIQKGDEVITNGGVLGKVSKISDDFIVLTIANDVDIHIQKSAITATLPKGTLKHI